MGLGEIYRGRKKSWWWMNLRRMCDKGDQEDWFGTNVLESRK